MFLVRKGFELRPIYKQTNPIADKYYYKIGAKPSDYEEYFKIPLMKKFSELHKNPTMRIKLSSVYNQTYSASMSMWTQIADLNPEIDIDIQDPYRDKPGMQDKLDHLRQEFVSTWMESNLKLYFDTIQHIVISYGNWRDICEASGHVMKESRLYSNSSSDSWLKKCKNDFYKYFVITSEYFYTQNGFFIEHSDKYF